MPPRTLQLAGAHLTPAGERVLQAADELARARQGVLDRLARGSGLPARVAALGLRTSMRNQLPCHIASLRRQGGAVDVRQEVLALCKATAVDVRAAPDAERGNVLEGLVSRATRGGAAGEVALSLAGGAQLVGFATEG